MLASFTVWQFSIMVFCQFSLFSNDVWLNAAAAKRLYWSLPIYTDIRPCNAMQCNLSIGLQSIRYYGHQTDHNLPPNVRKSLNVKRNLSCKITLLENLKLCPNIQFSNKISKLSIWIFELKSNDVGKSTWIIWIFAPKTVTLCM